MKFSAKNSSSIYLMCSLASGAAISVDWERFVCLEAIALSRAVVMAFKKELMRQAYGQGNWLLLCLASMAAITYSMFWFRE